MSPHKHWKIVWMVIIHCLSTSKWSQAHKISYYGCNHTDTTKTKGIVKLRLLKIVTPPDSTRTKQQREEDTAWWYLDSFFQIRHFSELSFQYLQRCGGVGPRGSTKRPAQYVILSQNFIAIQLKKKINALKEERTKYLYHAMMLFLGCLIYLYKKSLKSTDTVTMA